jgi:hypothetical protein
MNGAQAVPSTGSAATGWARVRLNAAETGGTIKIFFGVFGSSVTAIHLHGPAASGATGPEIMSSFPGASGTSGASSTTHALDASHVAALKAGLLYFDIHTGGASDPEIRGQLAVEPVLTANLTGAQESFPNMSDAIGRAWVSFNPAETQAMVTLEWSGITSGATEAHVHPEISGGTNSTPFCTFSFPSGLTNATLSDVLCFPSPAQVAQLKRAGMNVHVHSNTFPGGEIRGQIKRSFSPCDFDGDAKSDRVIVRNTGSTLDWWILKSGGGIETFPWGAPADFAASRLLCPDVDGDGKADATVWRDEATAAFYARLSSGGMRAQVWGTSGDNPRVTGDYDGDARDDLAIYRPGASGVYWILLSTTGAVRADVWGMTGDLVQAVPDYDGDARADLGVQRGTAYWRKLSSTGAADAVFWGGASDAHQSADHDGDARTDVAVVQIVGGTSQQWWTRSSLTGTPVAPYGNGFFFGTNTDHRVSADYDGDSRTDVAVWTPGNGAWWVQGTKSGLNATIWGASGDLPVQAAYWH